MILDTNATIAANSGLLLRETRRIVETTLRAGIIYVLVVGGFWIVTDLAAPHNTVALLTANIVSVAAGYFLVVAMLRHSGLVENNVVNGFGSYFGVSLLTGLAIILGFVFGILPGIYLLVRWMPVFGFLLSGNQSVTDAMGTAFAKTEGHFWSLLLAGLAPLSIIAVGLLIYSAPEFYSDVSYNLATVIGNVLLVVGTAFFTAYGLAAYSLLRDRSDELTGVFE